MRKAWRIRHREWEMSSWRKRCSELTSGKRGGEERKGILGGVSVLHLSIAEYTFFWSAYGTFSMIDHMLNLRTSLNKFKNWSYTKYVLQHTFCSPRTIKTRRKFEKLTLNNTFLNNQWIKEEIIGELGKYLEINQSGGTTYLNSWHVAKADLEGNLQPIRKEKINFKSNLSYYFRVLQNKEWAKPKASRKRKKIKNLGGFSHVRIYKAASFYLMAI